MFYCRLGTDHPPVMKVPSIIESSLMRLLIVQGSTHLLANGIAELFFLYNDKA